MAVQKSRVSPSRRGMRRAHDALSAKQLSNDPTSGETHRRHHVTADGYYRGKQVVAPKFFFEQKTAYEMAFARIAGTGSYLPEKVLTNDDLAKIVDTSDEWIATRTGIRERHVAAEGETTGDL